MIIFSFIPECYTIFINNFYQCPFLFVFDLGGVRFYLATLQKWPQCLDKLISGHV